MSDSPKDVVQSNHGPVTIAELRERCRVVEPGIVMFSEHPHANAEVFLALIEIVKELGRPFGEYAVIIDLRTAKARPKPDMVDAIIRSLKTPGVIYWGVVMSGNLAIKTIAKFVLGRLSGVEHTSMHSTEEEALAAARAAVRDASRASPQ